jgi:teichuronic acid biosynthesis glycosyltransferase TuaC
MRILSLSTIFPNASEPGLGTFVEARLQALAKRATVSVITPLAPFDYDNPRRRGLGRRSVPLRRTQGRLEVLAPAWAYPPGSGFLNGVLLGIQLLPLVGWRKLRTPFDVIDAHFAHPEGVAAALLGLCLRCPFTITMRGSALRHSRYRLRRRTISWALSRAGAVFAVSDELARLAVALGAPPERVHVVMNGVDPDDWPQLATAAAAAPKSDFEILSVGRLIASKGHQHVIRAIAALHRRGLRIRLRIVGEVGRGVRTYEPELLRLAKSLSVESWVCVEGWLPQGRVAEIMGQADLLCLASEGEGCPNVVWEALACGTPVVANDVGTVRRQIPDERFGLVVPCGDAQALEDALRQALEKTWDRDAIARWGRAREWDTVASDLISVFESILAPAPAQRSAAEAP